MAKRKSKDKSVGSDRLVITPSMTSNTFIINPNTNTNNGETIELSNSDIDWSTFRENFGTTVQDVQEQIYRSIVDASRYSIGVSASSYYTLLGGIKVDPKYTDLVRKYASQALKKE
jgi:hypothetical protein